MAKTTTELKVFSVCYRPPFSQGMNKFIIDHVTSSMVSPHKGALEERETEHYLFLKIIEAIEQYNPTISKSDQLILDKLYEAEIEFVEL
jgi:trans-aconitate methyltransferase